MVRRQSLPCMLGFILMLLLLPGPGLIAATEPLSEGLASRSIQGTLNLSDPGTLSFQQLPAASGVKVEPKFSGIPDENGILKSYLVEVPSFIKACYYAPFQKYDPVNPLQDSWPMVGNRVQPLAVSTFDQLKRGGVFLLLKVTENQFLALLPIAGPQTVAWFNPDGGKLYLNLGSLGTAPVKGNLPLIAWARSYDPYIACRRVWETAIQHWTVRESTRLREDKPYPEIFTYLGWCSWEHYRQDINESLMVQAATEIEASGLPIRFMLIDAGHLDQTENQLLSFTPDSTKFPNGWAPLLSMKKPDKIRWMGLWLNFNGSPMGISPANALGALNDHLLTIDWLQKTPMLLPKLGMLHAFAFYDGMIGTARRAGFDFVKVDYQASNLAFYQGTSQPVAAAADNAQAMETACARHMDGLINCMAQNSVCLFNTRLSAVSRCSDDYRMGDIARARRHLHNSYGNIPWLGQTVWGDHDMFHSSDPVSGRIMAISRALSGGPVYLSDEPTTFVPEIIRPLCTDDGQILRPLAPAAPLPDSLFLDPFSEKKPFRVVAPLPNDSAAVAVYNLTEPEVRLTGFVSRKDYTHANAMIQPPAGKWAVPEEGLLLYDWQARQASVLGNLYTFAMKGFGDRLFLLAPIRNGWSVVGRADKYLAPAAVQVLGCSPGELLLTMRESGNLVIWRSTGRPISDQCDFQPLANGLWQAEIPAGTRDLVVRVTLQAS